MKTLTIGAIPHSFDGSSYYRIWLPFRHLDLNSHHECLVAPPGSPMPNEREASGADAIVFQRPAGKAGAKMLESLMGHTKLIYEIDDDMLNATSSGLPHLVNEQARASIKRCLRLCDVVTTSCEHLAEIVKPYNDNIVVLQNHVKAGLLEMQRPKRDKLTIGWAGGTSHGWDMMEVAAPLKNVLADNPDVDMHFVGADHSHLLGRQWRWSMWQPDVGDYYKNIDFDIAIAPSGDQLFNRSKTWLRALEMGALGIPIVASNRLPYSDYVRDGVTGFLVNSEEEWQKRLTELINDPEMREEMGANARAQASEWTIEKGWKKWEAAYEHAVQG